MLREPENNVPRFFAGIAYRLSPLELTEYYQFARNLNASQELQQLRTLAPISPIPDVIVKDFMGLIPTAGAFPWRLQMTKPPAFRQGSLPSGTIRMSRGKPAARGPG